MAVVRYEKASRVYPGATVASVNQLDLAISDGEFVVLLGPSGSGKSTALRMLAGLEDLTEGAVFIGEQDVSQLPPKERDVAMVFQNYALYPHMSVAENMGFALKLAGVPKEEREAKVREAAGLLDLDRYLDRKPKALSGGQRQRVAMARAIVRNPAVFLMDEPLSNLDAKLRVETRAHIVALQARLGTTTIYATHDQAEAVSMGHRIAVLRQGSLQQADIPRNLYDRPKNTFVAGYVGAPAMNLVRSPLVPGGARLGNITAPLSKDALDAAGKAGLGEVILGVRPESLRVATTGADGLIVKVNVVEKLGADAYVYGDLPGSGSDTQFVARFDGQSRPSSGDLVTLTVGQGESHAFNPTTGERLGH